MTIPPGASCSLFRQEQPTDEPIPPDDPGKPIYPIQGCRHAPTAPGQGGQTEAPRAVHGPSGESQARPAVLDPATWRERGDTPGAQSGEGHDRRSADEYQESDAIRHVSECQGLSG